VALVLRGFALAAWKRGENKVFKPFVIA